MFEKYFCKDTIQKYILKNTFAKIHWRYTFLGNTFAKKHLRNTFAKIHFSNIFFEKYLLARQMSRLEVSMSPTEKVPPNSKQQPGHDGGDVEDDGNGDR